MLTFKSKSIPFLVKLCQSSLLAAQHTAQGMEFTVIKRGCTRKSTTHVALGSRDLREIRTSYRFWAKNSHGDVFSDPSRKKVGLKGSERPDFRNASKSSVNFLGHQKWVQKNVSIVPNVDFGPNFHLKPIFLGFVEIWPFSRGGPKFAKF